MINFDKFIQIPTEEATSYKGKDVVQIYENYYWLIYNNCILINQNGGKLCNKDKNAIDSIFRNTLKENKNVSLIKLNVVFINWDN